MALGRQGERQVELMVGWAELPRSPGHAFYDRLQAVLVEAGFADPVMDQESLQLTWRNGADALVELRSLGSNVALSRVLGLRTPRWQRQLEGELDRVAKRSPSGRVELTFELVYGHAFKALARARVASESSVGLADMRAMLRSTAPHRP